MTSSEGISVADALALRNTNSNNDGMAGFGGAWWLIILILFFAIGGWGNGFGNNNGNNGYGYNNCCTPATTQGLTDAFNFNKIDNALSAIDRDVTSGLYATNNTINGLGTTFQTGFGNNQLAMLEGFNTTQQAISNLGYQNQSGFCGVNDSIMTTNFNNQAGFNGVQTQLAANACDIKVGQDNIRTAMTQMTNDIINANERGTDRIINYLTQNEMDRLRTELQAANFQISQAAQTNDIVNQLQPVAKPAYITCSPYVSSYGLNNCGCNMGM